VPPLVGPCNFMHMIQVVFLSPCLSSTALVAVLSKFSTSEWLNDTCQSKNVSLPETYLFQCRYSVLIVQPCKMDVVVRFQVVTTTSMKMTVFWVAVPCSIVGVY
jgi:hypothetical protein